MSKLQQIGDHRRRRRLGLSLAICVATFGSAISGCVSTSVSRPESPQEYAFWPPFPAEPRVQFLTSYRYTSDITKRRSGLSRAIFGEGSDALPIVKPYGVALWKGRVYICDIRQDAVVVLDLNKHETRLLVARRLGGLTQPVDICVAEDGTKYVADLHRGSVFVFDAQDRSTGAFGWSGFQPAGLAVDRDRLYVADFESQTIVVLNRITGDRIGAIGGPGSEDGQFVRPLGVAIDPFGNVVVSDVIRCRVQVFSPEGRLIRAFAEAGDSVGTLARPKHIAIDNESIIYVIDSAFQNIQMFSNEGEVLTFFGTGGSHLGGMNLPAGVDVSNDPDDLAVFADKVHPFFEANRIVVTSNQFGVNKVSIYAIGQLKPGITAQDLIDSVARIPEGVQSEEGTPGIPTPLLPEGQTVESSDLEVEPLDPPSTNTGDSGA